MHRNRSADGRWPLQHAYRGKTWFEMERVGAPSRWNTLRALCVLAWWRRVAPAPPYASERAPRQTP